jgi:Tfp pilus assembly PilM family ATPase
MATTVGKNLLGIYVSPKEICIAQVKIGKDSKPESEHLVKFPTGFEVKEGMLRPLSLNHEFFSEKASWVAPFKQAIKKVSWGSSSAVVTLSPQFSILRYFLMPAVERRFWSRSIPLESKKYIPVSFEEVVYDYNAVPVEGGKKMGVLFGLTQRKSVEFIISILKASGLELAAVEVNSVSMERLFGFLDQTEHDSKGYIHFSGNSTLMLFSHGGYPVLYRESDTDASGTMSERRRLDVKGAVQFVDRYVGGKDYKNIMLSGDGADAWKPLAEKEAAPIAVAVWDASGACSLKDNDASGLFAMGAALRGRVPGKMLLDISGISTAIGLEKQVQSYVWNITFILGGFLLLLSLIAQVRLSIINSTVSSLEAKVGNVPDLQGNDSVTITAKITRLQDNVKILSALVTDTDALAPKLSAIAERIPTELWLGELQYSNPFALVESQGTGKDLRLSGETMLKGEVKIRVVDSFTKGLKAAEEFKPFYPPTGSIDSTTDSEGSSAGVQPAYGGAAVKASGFSIMCASKRK